MLMFKRKKSSKPLSSMELSDIRKIAQYHESLFDPIITYTELKSDQTGLGSIKPLFESSTLLNDIHSQALTSKSEKHLLTHMIEHCEQDAIELVKHFGDNIFKYIKGDTVCTCIQHEAFELAELLCRENLHMSAVKEERRKEYGAIFKVVCTNKNFSLAHELMKRYNDLIWDKKCTNPLYLLLHSMEKIKGSPVPEKIGKCISLWASIYDKDAGFNVSYTQYISNKNGSYKTLSCPMLCYTTWLGATQASLVVIRWLDKYGKKEDLDVTDDFSGASPLSYALRRNMETVAEELLKRKVNVFNHFRLTETVTTDVHEAASSKLYVVMEKMFRVAIEKGQIIDQELFDAIMNTKYIRNLFMAAGKTVFRERIKKNNLISKSL